MIKRIRFGLCALCASVVSLGLLVSCTNPLFSDESDYGPRQPVERLRSVKPLDLSGSVRSAEADEERIRKPPEQLPDFFAGRERAPVTIEQVRGWTIQNNLDLRVALVDPVIAQTSVTEEEARFEWLFFNQTRFTKLDQPTATSLEGSQVDDLSINTGVQIPLRSGGVITLDVPMGRTETNNSFATLNPSYESDARFSISQPLLRDFGRRTNTHQIRLAALESQIVQSRTNLEVIRVLAEADRAYWRLYAAGKLLEVAEQQYQLAQEQLGRARRRVDAQVAPEIEVIRAESGVAERVEAIIQAINGVQLRQRELKRIINVPGLDLGGPQLIEPSTLPAPVPFELDAAALAGAGVQNRMEMLELELRLAQDISSIDFARNQALPLFLLDYSYTVNGLGRSWNQSFRQVRDNNFEDWSVGARLEIPLGNEAAESRLDRAILQRLQRLSTRDAREQAIRLEVFAAIDLLNAAWQRILAARQAALLASRTLRGEQNQFEAGTRTSTEVLDAASTLAQAQSNEIIALAEYEIAQIDLAFATGTLLGATRVTWEPLDPRLSSDIPLPEGPMVPAESFDDGTHADPMEPATSPDDQSNI